RSANLRSVPKTTLARPLPTCQTGRKGRLNFLYPDQHYLNQVAMSLNTRPRKALDWLTPLEKFAQLVDYHMAFETVAPHV
ncbi:TPA: hypothetical protein ACQQHG_006294, partial [Pseudomonas aeruginosa]